MKNILLAIQNLALKIDNDVAFGGKSKGNKHLWRVTRIAKFLAEREQADMFVVLAGAWLHDVALSSGDDYDYVNNKKIVKKLLRQFKLSKQRMDNIAECVASHEGAVNPKSLEAKIVHDADVLDKTGWLGVIRHTWKLVNSGKIDAEKFTNNDAVMVLNHIRWRKKRLQTKLAKKIAKYLTVSPCKKRAKEVMELVAKLAVNGVVTEKIAIRLKKCLGKKQNKKLCEQLKLDYLCRFGCNVLQKQKSS